MNRSRPSSTPANFARRGWLDTVMSNVFGSGRSGSSRLIGSGQASGRVARAAAVPARYVAQMRPHITIKGQGNSLVELPTPFDAVLQSPQDLQILRRWSPSMVPNGTICRSIDLNRVAPVDLQNISEPCLAAVYLGLAGAGTVPLEYRDNAPEFRSPDGAASLSPVGVLTAMAAYSGDSALVKACRVSALIQRSAGQGLDDYLKKMPGDHHFNNSVVAKALPELIGAIERGNNDPALWDAACLVFAASVNLNRSLFPYMNWGLRNGKTFPHIEQFPPNAVQLSGSQAIPCIGRRMSQVYNLVMKPNANDTPRRRAVGMAVAYGGFLQSAQKLEGKSARLDSTREYAANIAVAAASCGLSAAAGGIGVGSSVILGPAIKAISCTQSAQDLGASIVKVARNIASLVPIGEDTGELSAALSSLGII